MSLWQHLRRLVSLGGSPPTADTPTEVADPDIRRRLEALERRRATGEIDAATFERERAELLGVPWIRFVSEYRPDPDGGIGTIGVEFEWNTAFVERLRAAGYAGKDDAAVVDAWFVHVCALLVLEQDPTLLEGRGLRPLRIERVEQDDRVICS